MEEIITKDSNRATIVEIITKDSNRATLVEIITKDYNKRINQGHYGGNVNNGTIEQ